MARTLSVGPDGAIREVDQAVLAPILATGQPDPSKRDHLDVQVNDTALGTNIRSVTLKANNDNSDVVLCWPKIAGKGNVGLFIPSGSAPPTWAAYMEGALYYDSAAHKLKVADNSAWVVAGAQS